MLRLRLLPLPGVIGEGRVGVGSAAVGELGVVVGDHDCRETEGVDRGGLRLRARLLQRVASREGRHAGDGQTRREEGLDEAQDGGLDRRLGEEFLDPVHVCLSMMFE